MCALNNIKILISVIVALKQTDCLFEVDLTDGRAIVPNDDQFVNFDNLRVKKVNHSDHFLIGTIEFFVDLSNDYEVCYQMRKKRRKHKKQIFIYCRLNF